MGVSPPLPEFDARGRSTVNTSSARPLQRNTLRGQDRLSVAIPSPRPAPWTAVYQQARRWLDAGVFEDIAHDLRTIVRFLDGREPEPTATIFEGRTIQSTPESGDRAGYDGARKKKGSKVHAAVDTLGNLLALKITTANEQERAQVAELAAKVQEVTGGTVEITYVDQGYTGDDASHDADQAGIKLTVVKHKEAKRGFALRPRRWVVERTFGWLGRYRRLARDYERLSKTLEGWH
jgi:transposase